MKASIVLMDHTVEPNYTVGATTITFTKCTDLPNGAGFVAYGDSPNAERFGLQWWFNTGHADETVARIAKDTLTRLTKPGADGALLPDDTDEWVGITLDIVLTAGRKNPEFPEIKLRKKGLGLSLGL